MTDEERLISCCERFRIPIMTWRPLKDEGWRKESSVLVAASVGALGTYVVGEAFYMPTSKRWLWQNSERIEPNRLIAWMPLPEPPETKP